MGETLRGGAVGGEPSSGWRRVWLPHRFPSQKESRIDPVLSQVKDEVMA